MPLMPKRVKFRKSQRGRLKGNDTRGTHVQFGEYGLQALDAGWLSARQIEAGRIAAVHFMGREGKLWKVFIFGKVKLWVDVITLGQRPRYFDSANN